MNKVLKMTIVLLVALFLFSNVVEAMNTNEEGKTITLTNNTATTTTNNENTNNNTSVYNNTNTTALPKTGTSSSIMIFIGLGIISAVYSFKKMSDYKANA